jgi:hypothetical protein
MTSNRAWYWMAAGVLALGLNGAYQDGEFSWAHCLVDRSMGLFQRISDHGREFVAMAEIMLGRMPEARDRAQAAVESREAVLDRSQAKLEALQEKMICERMANLQRRMAMEQVRRALIEADVERKLAMAQADVGHVRVVIREREGSGNCAGMVMPQMPKIALPGPPDFQVPNLAAAPHTKDNGPI